jgi:tRNA1Val (adenine37-N6)-methyltransferase
MPIMPNSFFRFKQFIIHQDRTAMKVCTDSCILGAWTASRLQDVKTILDIGTGTGLLPLMLAQKSGARIDTIESDPDSAAQAEENIQLSPWQDRIRLLPGDVRSYPFSGQYDFIISNPPFFESDLRSPSEKKNVAKHDQSLTLDELIFLIRTRLDPSGNFSILLPFHRSAYFEKLAAETGFFLKEKLTVRQSPGHAPFRTLCLFCFHKPEIMMLKELFIKDEQGKNNETFCELMQDYYL